jgi:hypothetical protein
VLSSQANGLDNDYLASASNGLILADIDQFLMTWQHSTKFHEKICIEFSLNGTFQPHHQQCLLALF